MGVVWHGLCNSMGMGNIEIGKYILLLNNRALVFVEGSVSERKYRDYAEALEAVRFERDKDVESGREAELIKDNKVFIYFTAEWEEQDDHTNIRMFMHANWALDKEIMQKIHDYDDRIVFV